MPGEVTITAFHDALVTSIGIDREELTRSAGATLTDLGVDSIGIIELEKVVADQHGVTLPEELPGMTIEEIFSYLASAVTKAG